MATLAIVRNARAPAPSHRASSSQPHQQPTLAAAATWRLKALPATLWYLLVHFVLLGWVYGLLHYAVFRALFLSGATQVLERGQGGKGGEGAE